MIAPVASTVFNLELGPINLNWFDEMSKDVENYPGDKVYSKEISSITCQDDRESQSDVKSGKK